MDAHRLVQPAAPHQHLLAATPSETCDFAWPLQATAGRHKGGSGSAPRPFHVVFQCSPEDEAALLARFQRHGRSLNRLK
jgi:hypothetical protein